MIRRSFRIGVTLGLLAGAVFALVKMRGSRLVSGSPAGPVPTEHWPPLVPDPAAAKPPVGKAAAGEKAAAGKKTAKRKAPARKAPVRARWVEPSDGVCPTTHPVKAKLGSKIFHLPGMLNYERTRPDRCYRDPEAAVDDDLRPAKR